jgi:serine/threonine-protein kinase
MPVTTGTRFGPYEVVAPIGAGGIGEVYRALDTRLKRFVALKLLRPGIATRPEFQERFEREARAISSLNHAHICTVHDVGQQHGVDYLVMEYVEGITLSEYLETNRLSMRETLGYGVEIADALTAAHRRGIIHRDLKPGNIMVTKAGVKILDFGLAKFSRAAAATVDAATTLTQTHVILGTPAYMAPEQMQGRDCDERTDIFALGLILYEMATGTRAFATDNGGARSSNVVRSEPLDKLGAPQYSHVVHRCLATDPANRWQTASDVKLELEWAANSHPVPIRRQRRRSRWLATMAAVTVLGCIGFWLFWRTPHLADRPLLRFNIDLGPGAVRGFNQAVWDRLGATPAILSPDGSRIAFVTRGADGQQRLATRLLDQSNITVLPGTENAVDPFFSPNGQWLGFFAAGRLKTVSVQGGAPRILGDGFSNDRGASWGDDDTIVLSPNPVSDLVRVPAGGGAPQLLKGTALSHSPQVLPGGRSVLVTRDTGSGAANIEVVSLGTDGTKVIAPGGYRGRYLPSGHVVFVHNGVLFGVDFDLANLSPRGVPIPLLDDVADGPIQDAWGNPTFAAGQFDFDRSGAFLYFAGKLKNTQSTLAWMDGSSAPKAIPLALTQYSHPRVSPDGRRLAVAAGSNIWVLDFARNAPLRLTYKTNFNQQPEWMPDGQHLVYVARSGSAFGLWWARADGAGEARQLLETESFIAPSSVSADGKLLAFHTWTLQTGWDIWTVELDITNPEQPKAGQPRPFLVTAEDEVSAGLSPDGRWIVYMSTDPVYRGILVRPLSGGGGPWQIATGDCTFPTWSADGRKLYYLLATKQIMEVDFSVHETAFVVKQTRKWSAPLLDGDVITNYSIHPDGNRAIAVMGHENENAGVSVSLLFNFFDEVRRRLRNPGK